MSLDTDLPEDEIGFSSYDYFNRKEDADRLRQLLYDNQSTVISLNASWGSGKSWFINECRKYWKDQISTIYYDAWKNETKGDPFISFCGYICSYLATHSEKLRNKENLKKFKNTITEFTKQVIPIGIDIAVQSSLIKNLLSSIVTAYKKATEDLLSDSLKSYDEKENIENSFKEKLSEYATEIKKEHFPLVVFIDELDRCSPTYMIHFLEVIKHHFEIKNIVYVLAIDKKQLCTSIKHHYGEDIDAEQYVKKIINIQYKLSLNTNGWITYVMNNKELNSLEAVKESSIFKYISLLSDYYNITPRLLERFAIACKSANEIRGIITDKEYATTFILFLFLKICQRDVYTDIIESKSEGSLELFLEIFRKQLNNIDMDDFILNDLNHICLYFKNDEHSYGSFYAEMSKNYFKIHSGHFITFRWQMKKQNDEMFMLLHKLELE